jgi:hypothetical protein
VLLNGDGCWRYLTDEVVMEALRRHTMIAQFNRCELAADAKSMDRASGIYPLFPDHDFGAIAAWAWGYHRCVDFLLTQKEVDAAKIAIAGHSRGGKCVLLAGATDTRIALTAPNNSGCGGAGSYYFQAPGSETLTDILGPFAYWFGPSLPAYAGRQNELPFDQHFLNALVAPRVLLTTEALGDLWANPVGTFHTHAAAKPVYALLGAADNIGVVYREGVHQHGLADWVTVLECMDWHFRGVRGERSFAGEAVNRGPVMEVGVKL